MLKGMQTYIRVTHPSLIFAIKNTICSESILQKMQSNKIWKDVRYIFMSTIMNIYVAISFLLRYHQIYGLTNVLGCFEILHILQFMHDLL